MSEGAFVPSTDRTPRELRGAGDGVRRSRRGGEYGVKLSFDCVAHTPRNSAQDVFDLLMQDVYNLKKRFENLQTPNA